MRHKSLLVQDLDPSFTQNNDSDVIISSGYESNGSRENGLGDLVKLDVVRAEQDL